MPKRAADELDVEPVGALERIQRREALVDAADADIERGLHIVLAALVDARVPNPVQELGIRLDVVDEIEHLGRGMRHAAAPVNGAHRVRINRRRSAARALPRSERRSGRTSAKYDSRAPPADRARPRWNCGP